MSATNIRKLISVIAVLCVLVTALPVGAAQPLPDATPRFSDVPADHLFTDDVDWLAAEGIARGCTPPRANDRFYPDAEVSRAQHLSRLQIAGNANLSGPISDALLDLPIGWILIGNNGCFTASPELAAWLDANSIWDWDDGCA